MGWKNDLDKLLAKLSPSEEQVILKALQEVEKQTRGSMEIEFQLKRQWALKAVKAVAQMCFWFFLFSVVVLVILICFGCQGY